MWESIERSFLGDGSRGLFTGVAQEMQKDGGRWLVVGGQSLVPLGETDGYKVHGL